MKAVCPKNINHREFETVAHVSELWKVDVFGNFIEVLEGIEVIAGPTSGNTWTCRDCGSEATVRR